MTAVAALSPVAALASWPVVRSGTLTCSIAGGPGIILASEKAMACRYAPSGGGRVTFYAGTIKKFGVDLGVTTGGGLIWSVVELAPSPGGLSGAYGGVSAEATVGLGVGANILFGGNYGFVTLQPLSFQGQAGANLAAGVGGITLTEILPLPPRLHKRRHGRYRSAYGG